MGAGAGSRRSFLGLLAAGGLAACSSDGGFLGRADTTGPTQPPNTVGDGVDPIATMAADPSDPDRNRDLIQQAIDRAAAAGGGEVVLPPGVLPIDLAPHPEAPAARVGLRMRTKVVLRGDPAGTTLLLAPEAADVDGIRAASPNTNLIIGSAHWDADRATPRQTDYEVRDLTIDGNAAKQLPEGGDEDDTTHQHKGLVFWRSDRCRAVNVIVQNVRGLAGNTNRGARRYETFHFDAQEATAIAFERCIVRSTDGGQTATGFSANHCDGVVWSDCEASGMGFHGFTAYGCTAAVRERCYSHGNGSAGFRWELSPEPDSEDDHDDPDEGARDQNCVAEGNRQAGWVLRDTASPRLVACRHDAPEAAPKGYRAVLVNHAVGLRIEDTPFALAGSRLLDREDNEGPSSFAFTGCTITPGDGDEVLIDFGDDEVLRDGRLDDPPDVRNGDPVPNRYGLPMRVKASDGTDETLAPGDTITLRWSDKRPTWTWTAVLRP